MAKPNDIIRRLRTNQGISQAMLARRTGISRQALGAIEAGIYQPSVSVALSLARELGETIESLFGKSSEPKSSEINAAWPKRRRSVEGSAVRLREAVKGNLSPRNPREPKKGAPQGESAGATRAFATQLTSQRVPSDLEG